MNMTFTESNFIAMLKRVFVWFCMNTKRYKIYNFQKSMSWLGVYSFMILIPLFLIGGSILYKKTVETFYADKIYKTTERILFKCKKNYIREECYITEFSRLSKAEELSVVKEVLLKIQEKDTQARKCHYIAHGIALSNAEKNVIAWKDILQNEDPYFCSEGFLHGSLEAYLSRVDYTANNKLFAQVCKEVDKGSRNEYSCAHIIGHLFLVDMNIDVAKSLQQCDILTPGGDMVFKEECYNGVFMELMDQKNIEAHGMRKRIPWDKKFVNTMEKECRSYTGLAASTCWKMISRVYTDVYEADASKIFDACNKAQDQQSREYCYARAIGMIPQSRYFKDTDINKICAQYKEENKFIRCNTFLVRFTLGNSPKFTKTMITYCQQFGGIIKEKCERDIKRFGKKQDSRNKLQDIFWNPISTFFQGFSANILIFFPHSKT